ENKVIVSFNQKNSNVPPNNFDGLVKWAETVEILDEIKLSIQEKNHIRMFIKNNSIHIPNCIKLNAYDIIKISVEIAQKNTSLHEIIKTDLMTKYLSILAYINSLHINNFSETLQNTLRMIITRKIMYTNDCQPREYLKRDLNNKIRYGVSTLLEFLFSDPNSLTLHIICIVKNINNIYSFAQPIIYGKCVDLLNTEIPSYIQTQMNKVVEEFIPLESDPLKLWSNEMLILATTTLNFINTDNISAYFDSEGKKAFVLCCLEKSFLTKLKTENKEKFLSISKSEFRKADQELSILIESDNTGFVNNSSLEQNSSVDNTCIKNTEDEIIEITNDFVTKSIPKLFYYEPVSFHSFFIQILNISNSEIIAVFLFICLLIILIGITSMYFITNFNIRLTCIFKLKL
ncbi:hypothetical protein HZS_4943, partial [Henneguya salminicola]